MFSDGNFSYGIEPVGNGEVSSMRHMFEFESVRNT